jgi:hypothetical protein
MRRLLLSGLLGLSTSVSLAGCVVSPPAGTATPPMVGVLPADARALRYGASAPDVLASPEMRSKVTALFGPDWLPAAQGAGQLRYGAASYFPAGSSLHMIRMQDRDFIAISGCVPAACRDHPGLLLIRDDGEQLWARLDEGGFSRYYGRGPALTATLVSPTWIDSAWRAVQRVGPVG